MHDNHPLFGRCSCVLKNLVRLLESACLMKSIVDFSLLSQYEVSCSFVWKRREREREKKSSSAIRVCLLEQHRKREREMNRSLLSVLVDIISSLLFVSLALSYSRSLSEIEYPSYHSIKQSASTRNQDFISMRKIRFCYVRENGKSTSVTVRCSLKRKSFDFFLCGHSEVLLGNRFFSGQSRLLPL